MVSMIAHSATPQVIRLPAPSARILIVEDRFYGVPTDEFLRYTPGEAEAAPESVDVLIVAGGLEIPATVAITLDATEKTEKPHNAVVALGCVIRGETVHYGIVAGESAQALMGLSLARHTLSRTKL
jgi:6,7-dimethyl-8-ribityllumazine synthase